MEPFSMYFIGCGMLILCLLLNCEVACYAHCFFSARLCWTSYLMKSPIGRCFQIQSLVSFLAMFLNSCKFLCLYYFLFIFALRASALSSYFTKTSVVTCAGQQEIWKGQKHPTAYCSTTAEVGSGSRSAGSAKTTSIFLQCLRIVFGCYFFLFFLVV